MEPKWVHHRSSACGESNGVMGLSNCLMSAIPSTGLGFAHSPPSQWRRCLPGPILATGAVVFRSCDSNSCFSGMKMAPLRLHQRGRFRCRREGSGMIRDLELGRPEGRRESHRRVNGIFWILLCNIGIFAADHLFQVREIRTLYLYHNQPTWYQFVTATFCHVNWNHLSSNLFFLYIFGKLVEEEEGNFALWLSYILTGAGANLVSWLVLPRNAVSVGASGAVFGLFAISVLVKMSWDWRKILEVIILGQFVIDKILKYSISGLSGELYSRICLPIPCFCKRSKSSTKKRIINKKKERSKSMILGIGKQCRYSGAILSFMG